MNNMQSKEIKLYATLKIHFKSETMSTQNIKVSMDSFASFVLSGRLMLWNNKSAIINSFKDSKGF